MSYSVGECKYCGQLVQVDEPYDTMEEAKEAAFAFATAPVRVQREGLWIRSTTRQRRYARYSGR